MENTYAAPVTRLTQGFNMFLVQVYGWMTLALSISFLIAFATAYFIERSIQFATFAIGIFPFIFIAQLIVVIVLSFFASKMNVVVSAAMFIFYAVTMGLFLGLTFAVYTTGSVVIAILAAVLVFGAASLYGLFTGNDLSSWGGFIFMAIFGLIIGTLLNVIMFFISPGFGQTFYWILTYVGIGIFIIAAAYDTQKLKNLAYEGEQNGMGIASHSIQGALILYLDFINIFIRVLMILGKSKN